MVHVDPPPQRVPQAPHEKFEVWRSTQNPPQLVRPVLHAHAPIVQVAVVPQLRPHAPVAEVGKRYDTAAADAQQRLDDEDQHGRLEAEEQRVDHRHLAGEGVDGRQYHHHDSAGNDKHDAGGEPAADPASQIAALCDAFPGLVLAQLGAPTAREREAEAERLLAAGDQPQAGDDARVDLCALHTVTIDDDDTRDIDDALSLERLADGRRRLWIHVADPGRLIAPDSPLDLEARRRGSSLYLAGGILPMFPEVLSNGPFSLRQRLRSAAWSLWVELADDGSVAASGIQRSWVKPAYRLSYGDADELIDLAPPEDPDLAELDQLLQRRRQWRVARGALLMDLPEGRIRCRDGEPGLEITEPSPSRALVAEAMILAGAVVAEFGVERGLALPFRSQLPADLPPAAELSALPDGAVRYAAVKRCLSRGLMGTSPAAHFSLGLSAYVQATSPIRRYGDLVVQRQIGAVLADEPPLSQDQLQEQLQTFETAVREGIGISREDQRHWQQVWFEQHRSSQWRAQFLRWLRPQDRLGLVRVDDLAMDLAAECPSGVDPGAELLLRVHQVDCLRDQLRLQCSAG